MSFTSAIEQRLEHIEQDISHGINPDRGQVHLSAADVQWLILLAKNVVRREPAITKKQAKISRVIYFLFLSALGVLSITGIVWGIWTIVRLISS